MKTKTLENNGLKPEIPEGWTLFKVHLRSGAIGLADRTTVDDWCWLIEELNSDILTYEIVEGKPGEDTVWSTPDAIDPDDDDDL